MGDRDGPARRGGGLRRRGRPGGRHRARRPQGGPDAPIGGRGLQMNDQTILVVDDEPFILRALTFVLHREGYRTVTATNGEDALRIMKELRPRLVFLDVMMPRKNGFEVCQEARSDPDLAKTCIILLTAKGQESDRARGMAAGADE